MLNEAFHFVYAKRKNKSHNDDIWDLCRNWQTIKKDLRTQLLNGSYQLSPVVVFGNKGSHRLTRWSSQDAVVLKAVALVLTPIVHNKITQQCHHIKGNGGLKGAINRVNDFAKSYKYFIKSDIADYYARMNHAVLINQCSCIIKDKRIIAIIKQYLNRVEIKNGNHTLIQKGIIKGCSLSPIMGAIMLKSLDDIFSKKYAYARYMDDWVILTNSCALQRRLVKKMHNLVGNLKLKLALAKTYIGKVSKGFDFLGYHFNAKGLKRLAATTVANHLLKIAVLYEQNATKSCIQQYKKNFQSWAESGLL